VNQAQRVLQEVKEAPRRRRTPLEGLAQSLRTMVGRVRQVVKQTRIRIFAGETKAPGKIVSVFEPHTEIIRKGKASKPHRVWQTGQDPGSGKPNRDPVRGVCGAPSGFNSVAALDPGAPTEIGTSTALGGRRCGILFARERESDASPGGRRMSVPNKKTKSGERKLLQRQGWFRSGQKWRTGSEGRISVLKRRHGLRRCLYPGLDGMRRWVGLGVIADNVIQIGRYLVRQST
jgi:IS5 family transposase